jgi:hypothetical protein
VTATAPKRGKPWALLAVLGGIGLGTVGMCGLGSWLVTHSIQRTIQLTSEAAEAGRGPLEVRSEAYRVVMRRTAEDAYVELFDGALARNGFDDSILRRLEHADCDAQLRVRTVGADAEVLRWLDFVTNAEPDGEPTLVHIAGLDTEALQRRYISARGVSFNVVGFVHGDVLFTLELNSDNADCSARAIASIELLGGEMTLPTPVPVDIRGPTFRIVDNRFESFVSGLVIDAPSPFVFASTTATNLWFEEDEVILLHPNGTEIHLSSVGVPEGELACEPHEADERSVTVTFEGSPRVFHSTNTAPSRSLDAAYCVGRTLVTITAVGPNQSRAEQALRVLEDRVHLQAPSGDDVRGQQRVGQDDWAFRNDLYRHFPSGMSWRRPPHAEVRTLGIVQRRDGYPEAHVQFEFQRRDLDVTGAAWAHATEYPETEYHEAFVVASLTHLGATEDFERDDRPIEFPNCRGSRSDLTRGHQRYVVATCVRDGWGIAFETRVMRTDLDGAIAFADAALDALSIAEASSNLPTFQVDGGSVSNVGDAFAFAVVQRGRLTLNVAGCSSWASSVALFNAVAASDGSGALAQVERSRVFAPTTPVTHIELSGFPAEERRLVIGDRALRVYTVLVDATAYVVSIRGPASTPESAWSELLATVHIDP